MAELGGPAHLEVDAYSNEKAVPVEVKMVVWVKRHGWEDEYGIEPTEEGYDFEEDVHAWFIGELENIRTQGEWPNVTEVTA